MNLPEGPFHPNGTPKLQDAHMVNVAADAMLKRLAQKRDEGASGWQTADPDTLRNGLAVALADGRLVDVLNYAAMLLSRGLPLQFSRDAVDMHDAALAHMHASGFKWFDGKWRHDAHNP